MKPLFDFQRVYWKKRQEFSFLLELLLFVQNSWSFDFRTSKEFPWVHLAMYRSQCWMFFSSILSHSNPFISFSRSTFYPFSNSYLPTPFSTYIIATNKSPYDISWAYIWVWLNIYIIIYIYYVYIYIYGPIFIYIIFTHIHKNINI